MPKHSNQPLSAAERELIHVLHANKTDDEDKRRRRRGGERLPAVTSWRCYWRRRRHDGDGGGGTVARCFPSLSPLCVFCFSFSSLLLPFSSLPSLLSSLSLLPLLPLSPLLFYLFLLPLPCFYRQKQGRGTCGGGHCAAAPPPSLNTWKAGQVGVPFRRLFEVIGGREVEIGRAHV